MLVVSDKLRVVPEFVHEGEYRVIVGGWVRKGTLHSVVKIDDKGLVSVVM